MSLPSPCQQAPTALISRDLGFVPRAEARRRPYASTEMVLERALPIGPFADVSPGHQG